MVTEKINKTVRTLVRGSHGQTELEGRSAHAPNALDWATLPARFLLAGGEVVNSALHAVELAGSFHRVNGVIVSCPRLYVFQSHAEHRIGMVLISLM